MLFRSGDLDEETIDKEALKTVRAELRALDLDDGEIGQLATAVVDARGVESAKEALANLYIVVMPTLSLDDDDNLDADDDDNLDADDDEGIMLPKNVSKGSIIKSYDEDGQKHYDFQFKNKRGYKMTIEGLDGKFNPEYWNYAKLISGVLRWRMPIDRVIKLVDSLQLDSENINTWKNGVERALKKYVTDGTSAEGQKCPNCGNETLVYQEGCLICKTCGTSRCG